METFAGHNAVIPQRMTGNEAITDECGNTVGNISSLSRLTFGIQPTFGWENSTNTYSDEKKRQSDIYVFCVHKHTDFDTVNPLDTSQWEFYLLPTADLDEKVGMQKRITLSSLINIGAVKCRYEEIRAKVDELIKRAE